MYRRISLILAASTLALVLAGCIGVDFSPDGRQLVVTTTKGLSIINTDGSNAVLIPQGDKGWMPNWSPDGKRILFTRHENKEGDLMLYEVRSRRVKKIGTNYEPLSGWREDGGRFVAIHKRPSGGIEAVEYDVVEGGVSMRVPLSFDQSGPLKIVWLPATDDFALLGGSGDNFDVYAVEAGEVKKITTTHDVIGLGLSGDGKSLLWARRSANMKYILLSVYSYDLKSRSVARLPLPDRIPILNPNPQTAPQKLAYVSFSPDGTRMAIIAEMPPRPSAPGKPGMGYSVCATVKLDGSDARLMYRTPPGKKPSGEGLVYPVWSRDGSKIALLELEEKLLKLAIFNADGTAGRRVFQEVTK